MADESLDQVPEQDFSVDAGALAIEALLKRPAEPEAQPEPQSQPAAPAQASAVETPAVQEQPVVPDNAAPAAPIVTEVKPASSPELESRLAEASKKAQEAEATRNQLITTLNALVPQLEATIKGQFADIKTEDDLYALADPSNPNYNVERYNAAIVAFSKLNRAVAAQQKAISDQAKADEDKLQQWRAGEQEKVGELIPELKDPAKGPALARKLEDYAIKTRGYTPQQLSRASANDFLTLYEGMMYREAQAKAKADLEAAQQKAAKAPPVQQPGTRASESTKDQKLETDYQRLQKTGRVDDAAAYFRNFLN